MKSCRPIPISSLGNFFAAFYVLALIGVFVLSGFGIRPAHAWQSEIPPSAPTPQVAPAAQFLATTAERIYFPLIRTAPSALMEVNPQDKAASAAFYHTYFLGSNDAVSVFTGNVANCNPGDTSPEFKAAVQMRINYFRAMAGVPAEIELDPTYNAKAQQAALMMSAQGALSHNPDTNWACYTAEGDQAASSSNLALGMYGPWAITGYMSDGGSNNTAVGHRRWILYPQTERMGTGDIPGLSGFRAANALWVFDGNYSAPRPATRTAYVAWPPPGYVPYRLAFARWSFSYPKADFSQAVVSMQANNQALALTQHPPQNGYGENTLVWELQLPADDVSADRTFEVQVNNVLINSQPQNFAYQVILFDPEQ
ncbi:MAG TPA: CAP domain-containing protein [Anaerolineales bacterium]|nr:CAP domain-containing protein [Anaerolineales bacterium]